MKYIIMSLILFVSLNVKAQDCSETSLMQKPGIWKEVINGSVRGIPPADLAKEKKIVESLQSMIKSKYTPMGVNVDFSGSYDSPYPDMPVNNYNYNILFLPYYCEGNIIKTAHETSTSFYIAANRSDTKIYDTYDENNTSGEGYFSMINMPVEKDGCYYFEEDASLGFGMKGKSRTWLITYDGKLLYTYASKKEFLEKRKQLLLREMSQSIASLNDLMKLKDMEKSMTEA